MKRAVIYYSLDGNTKEAAQTILEYAEAHLPAEETHYLTPFYEMIK